MNIIDRINAKKASNTILNEKISIVAEKTKRDVFTDFNYKVGKLIGLLMAIQFSGKYKNEILPMVNLEEEEIDVFAEIIGSVTFINADGALIKGKEQDSNALQEFVLYISDKWNLGYSNKDVDDINKERFEEIQNIAQLKAEKTLEIYSAKVDYDE